MRVWILPQRPDPEALLIIRLLGDAREVMAAGWTDFMVEKIRQQGGVIYAIERDDWPQWAKGRSGEADCVAALSCIDHHHPGDPGYGRIPSEFLAASSLGQVIAELARLGRLPWSHWGGFPVQRRAGEFCGLSDPPLASTDQEHRGFWYVATAVAGGPHGVRAVPVPSEYVFAAAADHCLAAAYRGECPGVDPDALMRWRIENRAAHQRRSVNEILVDIERARKTFLDAPVVHLSFMRDAAGSCTGSGCGRESTSVHPISNANVYDLRASGYVPELPEAAVREGVAYLARVRDPDGREKIVLGGHTTPELIRAFMESWGPKEGLMGIYGDPVRGFAGGYCER